MAPRLRHISSGLLERARFGFFASRALTARQASAWIDIVHGAEKALTQSIRHDVDLPAKRVFLTFAVLFGFHRSSLEVGSVQSLYLDLLPTVHCPLLWFLHRRADEIAPFGP